MCLGRGRIKCFLLSGYMVLEVGMIGEDVKNSVWLAGQL